MGRRWPSLCFTDRKLHRPLVVSAASSVTLPQGGIVQTGTTPGNYDVVVTLIQEVTEEDLPLLEGYSYRISLDFQGSPLVG